MAPFIRDYGIRKFKKAKKLHFKLKLEAGEPGGTSSISRMLGASIRGNTVVTFGDNLVTEAGAVRGEQDEGVEGAQ